MNKILTLEQIKKMSIEETTNAYRNGYVLEGMESAGCSGCGVQTVGTMSIETLSVTCKTINLIAAAANITAISISTIPAADTQYTPGQTITASVTWKNDTAAGGLSSTFTPKVTFNGIIVYGSVFGNTTITLSAGATHTDGFSYSVPNAGAFIICPVPN